MAGRRKFKVKVRGKVRNQLLRRGGAAAGLALGLAASLWFLGAAFKVSHNFLTGRFLSFNQGSFEVNCPAPGVAESLRSLTEAASKAPLTSRRCAALVADIKRLHPGLSTVKIGRNFVTGKARITAEPETAVAEVLLNGSTSYLGASGRFMPENLSSSGAVPFRVEIAAEGPQPSLASFIASVKPLTPLFDRKPVSLSCRLPGDGCLFSLEDGSSVLWGEFEFTRTKILRLNEVMERASRNKGGPLKVDLRYFREGKIFVSAVK